MSVLAWFDYAGPWTWRHYLLIAALALAVAAALCLWAMRQGKAEARAWRLRAIRDAFLRCVCRRKTDLKVGNRT